MGWRGFGKRVSDYIFPVFCLGCKKEGVVLCAGCQKLAPRGGVFACPVCQSDRERGETCNSCLQGSSLEQLVSIDTYHSEGLLGQLIEAWKYQMVEEVEEFWHTLCVDFFEAHGPPLLLCDIVTPVPLHRRRYAERGFNQSEALAGIISSVLSQPQITLLQRMRYTQQQARLSQRDRQKNVAGAFALQKEVEDLRGKRILIVDDVFTSGATMQECAAVLRQAGAAAVSGFTIARRM